MVQVRKVLDSRYSLGDAVPGTRSCHHFEPSSTISIKGKQLSDDHVYTIKDHSFSALPTAGKIALKLKPNSYATCIFDGFWWLVLVDSINVEKKDASSWSNKQFSSLHTDDVGYEPFHKFTMTAEIPQFSSNVRRFLIKEQELKHTNSVFENLK